LFNFDIDVLLLLESLE